MIESTKGSPMIDEKFQYTCDVCGEVIAKEDLRWSESDRHFKPFQTWHFHGPQSDDNPCWTGLQELQTTHYATAERFRG